MFGKLNLVIIFSGDAIKCATFFKEHFEMSPIGEWSEEWAELDGGSCRLAFHQAYDGNGNPITGPTGSPNNPHTIVFQVPDVQAAHDKLTSNGVKLGPVQKMDFGGTLCIGEDPEGHIFQLCDQ